MNKQEHCDLLIDYYNKCLDEDETKSFEEHLRTCSTCKEELEELNALTADLPLSSEPIEPNEGMKDRILSNVFDQPIEKLGTAEKPMNTSKPEGSPNIEAIIPEAKKEYPKPRKNNKWLIPLLAASLLLSLTTNVYLFMTDQTQEAGPVEDEPISEVVMNLELAASEGYSGNAEAAMLQKENGMNLVVQAHNLPEVSGTQAYQVWLIDSAGEKFRAGTFVPNQNGTGAVSFPVNIQGEHEWQSIAVTLEPTPNSEQPEGDIVLAPKL